MPNPLYVRAPDVVWRMAADRVLVRRVGDRSMNGHADLSGLGALLWLAVDRPCSTAEIRHELAAADVAAESTALEHVLTEMLNAGWLNTAGRTTVPVPGSQAGIVEPRETDV